MQLTIISCVFFLLILVQDVKAQFQKLGSGVNQLKENKDSTEVLVNEYVNPDWQKIDIGFLSSYYTQDGNKSPVTGGIGTEELTDFTQKISISAPLSERLKIILDGGYDYYTSASTDMIDNIQSSASSADMRMHGNAGFEYKLDQQNTIGLKVGGSSEYDYYSFSTGANYNWQSKDQNTSLGLSTQAFFDTWSLFYPSELRRQGRLVPTDRRQSYNSSISISRVLNKRMQGLIQLESTRMTGLLSTPFHRVYFQEQEQARVEQLPLSRMKYSLGSRLNISINEYLIARMFYRYYFDNWGIKAHTASIELPVKLNRFMAIYPHYRYHQQAAAEYFAPYKEHRIQSEFYSSDYDLSALKSHSIGLGFTFAPQGGLMKVKIPLVKNRILLLEGIDIKYSYYMRSTDLRSHIISAGMKFGF